MLTGGMGYIGSHTSVVLSKLGHQVVLYDNLSNSSHSVLEKLVQITGQKIPFIRGDMVETELLKSTLISHNIDSVIHFAGLKAVGESVEKPVDYYANNVQGTISLLLAMQLAQVKTQLQTCLKDPESFLSRIVNDPEAFKLKADGIIANRLTDQILDVQHKVYTRDLFGKD